MTDPTTRPGELSRSEADKIASAIGARIHQRGGMDLNKIILAICAFACVSLISIFGWIAIHVIGQQDDTTRRLSTVEAKLDILLSDRHARP